jgi:Spy/CpxP family protein refolding chaperone
MSQRWILRMAIGIAFACAVPVAMAQQPQPGEGPQPPQPQGDRQQPPPPPDPLGDSIFPPEMIMQHQRELALTDEQKTFMRGEIQRTTTRFNELQWQLQDQMEALHETVKSNSINEQLALSQLDKVLESEREIKRLHMEMAIRIKNKLTADQQMKLQTIRQNMRPRGDGPGMGPGRGPGQGRPGGPGGGMGPGGPGPAGPRPGQGPGQGPGAGRPGGPR